MARLNEPPQIIENHEAIKRSLLRKNRDLTRAHAAQIIRVRNLDEQLQKLTVENADLRQRLITCESELDRYRRSDLASTEILVLRDGLQQKLAEINSLVAQFGDIPQKIRKRERSERRQSRLKNFVSSPTKDIWQAQVQNPPSLRDAEQRLARLDEHRFVNRFSIGVEDAQPENEYYESASMSLSPKESAPIEVSIESTLESVQDMTAPPPEINSDSMLQNIERRRKRRTSSLVADLETPQNLADGTDKLESESDTQLSRRTVKRKLDADVLEPGAEDNKTAEEFVFQRKPVLKPIVTSRKSNRFTRPQDRQVPSVVSGQASSPSKERLALAPKSTNSPTKQTVDSKLTAKPNNNDLIKVQKSAQRSDPKRSRPEAADERQSKRPQSTGRLEAKRSEPALPPSVDIKIEPTEDVDMAPKTPFLTDDMFSPQPSEPSQPGRRVKQEAIVQNGLEEVLSGSLGRASRRAKSAVSYAEPNLRDKMRRPGKELVGAVEGYERKAREGSLGAQAGHERSNSTTALSEEPRSPLHEKQAPIAKRAKGKLDIQSWAAGDQPEASIEAQQSLLVGPGAPEAEPGSTGLSIFDHPTSSPAESRTSGYPGTDGGRTTPASEDIIDVAKPSSRLSTSRGSKDQSVRQPVGVPPRPTSARLSFSNTRPSAIIANQTKSIQNSRTASTTLRRSSSASGIRPRRRESADSILSLNTSGSISDVEDASDNETGNVSLAAENGTRHSDVVDSDDNDHAGDADYEPTAVLPDPASTQTAEAAPCAKVSRRKSMRFWQTSFPNQSYCRRSSDLNGYIAVSPPPQSYAVASGITPREGLMYHHDQLHQSATTERSPAPRRDQAQTPPRQAIHNRISELSHTPSRRSRWSQELQAATRDRDRQPTTYGLREQPRKTPKKSQPGTKEYVIVPKPQVSTAPANTTQPRTRLREIRSAPVQLQPDGRSVDVELRKRGRPKKNTALSLQQKIEMMGKSGTACGSSEHEHENGSDTSDGLRRRSSDVIEVYIPR
ncbi:Shugoshin [Cyphellophora attinorum]|uniref:Shugoshin n=1 Tax=Cyphellophora attinorum TaxID=1664694 RepID=A0A0N1H8F6_9EURO|nr:Shugoshin [Phialophora attinorum]KPI43170.1 Shugoshin [Phialophora attinorum]